MPSRNLSRVRAAGQKTCSGFAREAKREKRTAGRPTGAICKELSGVDLVPCKVCGLRGHEPGDREKCIGSSQLMQRRSGLGGQWW